MGFMCRSCNTEQDDRERYERSDWCRSCVTLTLHEQELEDTQRVKPEVFHT